MGGSEGLCSLLRTIALPDYTALGTSHNDHSASQSNTLVFPHSNHCCRYGCISPCCRYGRNPDASRIRNFGIHWDHCHPALFLSFHRPFRYCPNDRAENTCFRPPIRLIHLIHLPSSNRHHMNICRLRILIGDESLSRACYQSILHYND